MQYREGVGQKGVERGTKCGGMPPKKEVQGVGAEGTKREGGKGGRVKERGGAFWRERVHLSQKKNIAKNC